MANQILRDRKAAMQHRQRDDRMHADAPVPDNQDRPEMLASQIVTQMQNWVVQTDPPLQRAKHHQATIPLLNHRLLNRPRPNRHRQNKVTGGSVHGVADDVADHVRKVAERDRR